MNTRFIILYVLLLIAQILIGNFLNLSQFLVINILPMLVLCIPSGVHPIAVLAITFVSGFVVDLFAGGIIGLSLVALLPVAFLRRPLNRIAFGGDIIERNEDISLSRHGTLKISIAILMFLLVFFIIYIPVDSAGTRSFGFNLLKIFLSTVGSYVVSLLCIRFLNP
ncbi:MAG: hypothetical protein MJY42_01770 [Bacteroidales bacterium]|nr:hypothetical protein [Bacteroidales bacterium]